MTVQRNQYRETKSFSTEKSTRDRVPSTENTIKPREEKMATRTKSTYEQLTNRLDKIAGKIHKISEENDLLDLSLLSSQLKAIKENLARLLWVELPELNDKEKYEKLFNRSTGIFFNPGIFEIDAMRQAFFKRQAQLFFTTEDEQQAYIDYTEQLYLNSTKTFREIKKETAQRLPGASYQEKQKRNITQFTLAMTSDSKTKLEAYAKSKMEG